MKSVTLALFCVGCCLASVASVVVVDFSTVSLSSESHYGGAGPAPRPGNFTIDGVTFPHSANTWGWTGFTYSNHTDTTTQSYLNQFSAITGGGSGDAIYGVAYAWDPVSLSFALPGGVQVTSIDLTNTTYAALTILNGDGFSRPFTTSNPEGNPDSFRLLIEGLDPAHAVTGSVAFYLADFSRPVASERISTSWETVDLTSLGTVGGLRFSLQSTDTGEWGMNTPAYFAFDNLTFAAVPEPRHFVALLGAVAFARVGWRRARR